MQPLPAPHQDTTQSQDTIDPNRSNTTIERGNTTTRGIDDTTTSNIKRGITNTHTHTHEAKPQEEQEPQEPQESQESQEPLHPITPKKAVQHAIAHHHAQEIISDMSPNQVKYCLARLLDPSWPLTTAAIVAGYTIKSAPTTASRVEKHAHVTQILRAAQSNRAESQNGGVATEIHNSATREEIIRIYTEMIRDPLIRNSKQGMEALKAIRELEDMDKSDSKGQLPNVLTLILNQIDGSTQGIPQGFQGGLLPSSDDIEDDIRVTNEAD